MRRIVEYEGNIYYSKRTDEDAEEFAVIFYNNISSSDSFKMELENGSFLVFGKDALQKAVFIFEK